MSEYRKSTYDKYFRTLKNNKNNNWIYLLLFYLSNKSINIK